MLKAGVLYPRSGIYPLLGADFLSGIKSSLAFYQTSEKIHLITEPIGFGQSDKEVYQKVEHMLLHDEVDIVIGFLDLKVLPVLKPLFTATGKFFVVVNPGANYPENWVPPAGTVYLSLMESFLCRLSGVNAVDDGNTQAIMATSFYDGGYQHCNAFVNGFVRNGGSIQYNYVSQQKIKDFDITPLEEFITGHPAVKALLCIFSGKEANLFYEQLNKIDCADPLQLYVSPMMLEEQNCADIKEKLSASVTGYIPWHSSLGNAENTIFKKTLQEHSKKQATIFSLLGWEAGLLLNLALANEFADNIGEKMVSLLHTTPLSSPRGSLQTDSSTNYLISPVYKAALQNNNIVTVQETLADITEEWKKFVLEENGVVASGWTNTYLCY